MQTDAGATRRIHGELIRRVRYRITKGGVLFTLAVILVGAAAVVSANNLLFLILATMISTILVSGLIAGCAWPAWNWTSSSRSTLPQDAPCPRGSMCATQDLDAIVLHPPGGIEDKHPLTSPIYFPVIPGGALLEETVEVRFPRRGAYKENSFAFSTRFPFGFLEKTARVTFRREVIVYPSIEPYVGFEDLLQGITGDIETHLQGLGKDFYRIRPYNASKALAMWTGKPRPHWRVCRCANLHVRRSEPSKSFSIATPRRNWPNGSSVPWTAARSLFAPLPARHGNPLPLAGFYFPPAGRRGHIYYP